MSTVGPIRADAYPGPDDDQQRDARLLVCTNAHDADDAALLLAILGLLPDPTASEDHR